MTEEIKVAGESVGEVRVLSKWETARDYLLAVKAHREAELLVKRLSKELKQAQENLDSAKLQEEFTGGMDSLFTAKSVRSLNKMLVTPSLLTIPAGSFPVSTASLSLRKGRVHIRLTFATPLFNGWKTEIPYISFQFCPVSLEVPPKPSENHVPRFLTEWEQDLGEMACWEQVDDELNLFDMDGKVYIFELGGDPNIRAELGETAAPEPFEQWLERMRQGTA